MVLRLRYGRDNRRLLQSRRQIESAANPSGVDGRLSVFGKAAGLRDHIGVEAAAEVAAVSTDRPTIADPHERR